MAKLANPEAVNPDLKEALRKSGVEDNEQAEDTTPLYQVLGNSKIPVSKNLGALWKSRIDQGMSAKQDVEKAWSEAIRYYENDQSVHRVGGETNLRAGNSRYQRHLGQNWSETENVVFSNVTAMLPMLYAKNPTITVTPKDDANQPFATMWQKLINALMEMHDAPGLNMKGKARRGVLWALLTNAGYAKIGYTQKQDSSEEALEQLQKLSQEYSKKDLKQSDIRRIEGEIAALEEKVSILAPSGPTVKLISPYRLVIDPTSIEPDHSDALWIAEFDYLQTDYVNAVYCKREDGKVVSIYEPTHVLKSDSNQGAGVQDNINNFSLFTKDDGAETAKNYGYANVDQFKKACYTKVWWIWDKTTRRLFLYADNQWKWPLWVWDDPYQLLDFYPYQHLWFHEQVEGSQPKGEVTYYLDQQDAINDINSDFARARNWARNNVFYDKNTISQSEVENVLKGPDGTARGVDVPDGKKLTDVIFAFTPPNMMHPEVFQNQMDAKFQAINRITGINDAQRGAQFKTNTTNDAVNAYQQTIEIRTDEKTDLIEDWIGKIAWKLMQLCARFMDQQTVSAIIGQDLAINWIPITDPNELRIRLNLTVVGGSSDKPTSKNKKQAAVQIGQTLGQFANGNPALGMVVLKIFMRAFEDDVNLTDDDVSLVMQGVQAQMQPPAPGPQGPPGPPGEAPPDPQQLAQLVHSLPPEAKQEMQVLIKHGTSPSEALQKVMGAGNQPGPQHPPGK